MNRNDVLQVLLIGLILFAILQRSCSPDRPVQDTSALEQRIDSLLSTTAKRDTLLQQSSDTVHYRVQVIRETIREYRTLHDTILRLQYCDSIIEDCEQLAYDCEQNDSLHRIQEKELKQIVTSQDTIITSNKQDLEELRRKNKFLKIGGGTVLAAAVLTLIFK